MVDALAAKWSLGPRDWHKKNQARFVLAREQRTILVEPQSFMNLSGPPVLGIATFYKVPPTRMLVVVDELDLPWEKLRLRASGSSGGHNGLNSLIEQFGPNFPRLRIGIGRDREHDAVDRVLGEFTPEELVALPAIVERAVLGIETWLNEGIVAAMNQVNPKV